MRKKTILLLIMIFTLAGICQQASAVTAFKDMYGHWAEGDVNELLYSGIVTGYEDSSFAPDNNISMNEIVVLVMRTMGEEITDGDTWYDGHVKKAKENGWIDTSDGEDFASPAKRKDVFQLIARTLPEMETDTSLPFSDTDKISSDDYRYIAAMYNAGLANGYEDGSFRPEDNITRAEAASLLKRAWMYVPIGEFVHKEWDLLNAPNDENTPFSIYTRGGGTYKFSEFTQMPFKIDGTNAIYSLTGAVSRPSLSWNMKNDSSALVLSAPDGEAVDKKGYTTVVFTAPENGNYSFSFKCSNAGWGGTGGDGGMISFRVLNNGSDIPKTVTTTNIPASYHPDMLMQKTEVFKLKKDDKILLQLSAHLGSVFDGFKLEYTVETTETEGKRYVYYGEKELLPNIPAKKELSGAPLRDNLVYIGASGSWAIGNFVEETVDILKQYIKNPAMNWYDTGSYSYAENAEYFKEQNIPILVQSYLTYSDYYDLHDAWEVNFKKEKAHRQSGFTLANSGHAASKSSQAVKDAFEYNIRSVARNGFSAFGFTDYIWMYGAGRGTTGYHPETIESFKRNLKGEDEGINITFYGGEPQNIHFKEYAEYYMGSMLTPQQLGFESWDEWSPLLYDEIDWSADQKQYQPQWVLFDLLINYELLRVAQHAGEVAKEEGIEFQILPNPEDQGNGNDDMFNIGLDSIRMHTTEMFNHTAYLDGAYFHYPYITKHAAGDKSYGMVLECGGGGNTGRYYDLEIGYLTAYEAAAATGLKHFEVDWWPTLEHSLDISVDNVKLNGDKALITLAYAVGYEDAVEDNVSRQKSDFISVTARYKNRPWSDYYPWNWFVWIKGSPEMALTKNGYIFDGIGQDGIPDIDNEKVVVYSPEYPARHNFEQLFEKLEKGSIENVIAAPIALSKITDFDYKVKPMAEVHPEYAVTGEPEKEFSGKLTDNEGNVLLEEVSFKNTYYVPFEGAQTVLSVGDVPVAVEKKIGNGMLYAVLFDPNSEPNYDLTVAVYNYLLGKNGIKQQFITNEASGELVGNVSLKDDAKSVPNMGKFEKNASVRLYNSGDMRIVGIQNPLSRYWIKDTSTRSTNNIPYKIKGVTDVSVRLEPNTVYDYVALPTGMRGTVTTDSEGMVNLSFEDVSHQIFYLVPPTTENQQRLAQIAKRRLLFEDTKTIGGLVERKDDVAPATNVYVEGEKTGDGYLSEAVVKLIPEDQPHGSGIKSLKYSIDGGEFVTAVKRSEINPEVGAELTLTEKGTHIVEYKAVDNVGNEEITGYITVTIE